MTAAVLSLLPLAPPSPLATAGLGYSEPDKVGCPDLAHDPAAPGRLPSHNTHTRASLFCPAVKLVHQRVFISLTCEGSGKSAGLACARMIFSLLLSRTTFQTS